ncbi:MAG: formylglycine-generating enzyme family protein [Polyangiaceae bacterium]|nr:formylglycine-generating enzyme family protein [Polyangiaceae bacterium]
MNLTPPSTQGRGGATRVARSALGRADLVRLAASVPAEVLKRQAQHLGYTWEDDAPPQDDKPFEEPAQPLADEAPIIDDGVRLPVPLWRLDKMTFSDDSPPEPQKRSKAESVLTDVDLKSPGKSVFHLPKTPPLTPWSRLWPVVRAALQGTQPGKEPDIPALLRAWSRGEGVKRIPRMLRRVWAPNVHLWVDRSDRLLPFWSDQLEVCRRVAAAVGWGSVRVRYITPQQQTACIARRGDLLGGRRPPGETPVLALSDLGTYGSTVERAAWLRTAQRLEGQKTPIAALVPAPRWRIENHLANAWAARPWEQGKSAGTGKAKEGPDIRAERLLRLISPALVVQPGLLRALRFLLPAGQADVSTEADVWSHRDVHAADGTGLVLTPDAALRYREEFGKGVPAELQSRLARALGTWHRHLPAELLRVETLAWLGMADETAKPPGDVSDARAFAARWAATVRRAMEEGTAEAARDADEIKRLGRAVLGAMPAHTFQVEPTLGEVWAAAFEGVSGVRVPQGVNPAATYSKLGKPAAPQWWAVRQVGDELVIGPSPDVWGEPKKWKGPPGPLADIPKSAWPSHDIRPGSPVAWLLVGKRQMYITWGTDGQERKEVLRPGLRLPLRDGKRVVLRTDLSTVTLGAWEREPWATAVGRDRFGIWADAEVRGQVLRFRWVPPGRFMMGSPEREEGRYDREGPIHLVTWTEGRWFADTPVTQALWQHVTDNNPNEFVTPDRPVEQVSWNDTQRFMEGLNGLAPGLNVRLPTEAEWEHACRAGTSTATWLGDLTFLGENNAPLLDSIAWYSGNCGADFDLEDGYDTSGWARKRFSLQHGGTRRVRLKQPNPLGLFDVLGNVLEWCQDAWDGPYPSNLPVTDPEPSHTGSLRVLRGGSWGSNARDVRAAYRYAYDPALADSNVGFRLVRGPRPGPAEPANPAEPLSRPRSGASTAEGAGISARHEPKSPGTGMHPLRQGRAAPWMVEWGEDSFGVFSAFKVGNVVQRLRWVPAGTFWMGSPNTEVGRFNDEHHRQVTLTTGVWMADTPCTQALWNAVMGNNPSRFTDPERPVEQVSWEDVYTFLDQLNASVSGLSARLPLEVEWERACRAGTLTATWAGDLQLKGRNNAPVLDSIAWYAGNSGEGFDLDRGEDSGGWREKQYPHKYAGTRKVALKAPNPLGLFDMLGNVLEWCSDDALDPVENTRTSPSGDASRGPVLPTDRARLRPLRGGSWFSNARLVRAACRYAEDLSFRSHYAGFRIVIDAPG